MNSTITAVLALLQLMWQAAYEDANQDLSEPERDQVEVDRAITRMETIADVIDAVKGLAGGSRG